MFLKTGSNGWRDSDPPGYFKLKNQKCILISINTAIARTTETAKFRKLKKRVKDEFKRIRKRRIIVYGSVARCGPQSVASASG